MVDTHQRRHWLLGTLAITAALLALTTQLLAFVSPDTNGFHPWEVGLFWHAPIGVIRGNTGWLEGWFVHLSCVNAGLSLASVGFSIGSLIQRNHRRWLSLVAVGFSLLCFATLVYSTAFGYGPIAALWDRNWEENKGDASEWH
jgi:hypothetical protein